MGQQPREHAAFCADDARERAVEEALQMGQTVSDLTLTSRHKLIPINKEGGRASEWVCRRMGRVEFGRIIYPTAAGTVE